MDLDERLCNLCQQGERSQAESLAKAVLKNEPVQEVVVDETHVHVDTPRFHGVHRLTTDRQGSVAVHVRGEYMYKSDTVKLSFSTATMNQQAHARTQAQLDIRNNAESQTAEDGQAPTDDPSPSEPDIAANTAERQATSPIGFLKGLL